MMGRHVLVLVPHPDDEVVGCAAAVARARASGAQISAFYLTEGVPPLEALWPWQRSGRAARVERRWREMETTAARMGIAAVGRQSIPSRMLKSHIAPTRGRLLELLNALRPDRLWVPAYEGGHQDHDVANHIASTVADRIEVWEFSEYNRAGGRVRSQEFPSPRGDEQILTLDEGERMEKRGLLALYESERANLGYVTVAQEAFRRLAPYDYRRPPHDGRVFYQRFQWVLRHPRVDHTTPEEVCRAIADSGFTGSLLDVRRPLTP